MPVYLNPYYNQIDSYQIVKGASDLAGDLDSSKVYVIDGNIDMGTQQIIAPQGGLTIKGTGFNTSKLYSTSDNYTMIIDDGVRAGDILMDSLTIDVSGTNSKVFDVDNAGNNQTLEFQTVNFENCTSCGDIRSYRQLLFTGCGWLNGDQGFALHGAMGGIALLDSIVLLFNSPTAYKLFAEGSGLSLSGSIRSNINALNVPADWTLIDFAESTILADAGLLFNGIRTTATNAIPNIASSSQKAFFKNCRGIDNTFVGGNYTITTSTATAIAVADTLYKMAGTTTYSDMAWFTQSTDNAFVYQSSEVGSVKVTGVLSFSGSNNREMAIQIRQWDDSASAYVDIGPEFKATLNGGTGGTRAENLAFQGIATVDQNDRIEIWIKNITDTTNITARLGGSVTITERAP